jgi:trehalose synthase
VTVTGAGDPAASGVDDVGSEKADLDVAYYRSPHSGPASGANPDYVRWLVDESMLAAAKTSAAQSVGQGSMWQNPYAEPNPRAAIAKAANWLTLYPISMITKPGCSFLGTLGDRDFWKALQQVGITAVHTGPVKRAGGISGWEATPSVDGHFDRISNRFDDQFGTEDEFRAMCRVAAAHGGAVIDDIVPGHTGKGADFRLAEMRVGDYPGIYHMVEIPRDDWHLLPDVPPDRDSTNLDVETEQLLADAGHIVGPMQRVIFNEPGVKITNWSTTGPVLGPDGQEHRWVYLHYFKEGQPSLNWLDPTFAGMRLVIGDALHSLSDLGSTALRLDANGFLGVEKSVEGPAWSEGHPLSEAANQLIGSMVRKVGGFTFQELNLAIDDIKNTSQRGPDLSYDFVNRPAYHHALATGDTEFLRLTMNEARRIGVDTASLVHALQNHDELTYELIHFATLHAADTYTFRNTVMTGAQLAILIRQELIDTLTGDAAPYNSIFTTNGISSTTLTVIAAALGLHDLTRLTPQEVEDITRAHLLLAMYNAWQPGVFALSGWDLVGALTLEQRQVADLTRDGDTRWIHRSAYDLMDYRPDATESTAKIPRGRALYGALSAQLSDPNSFARRLRDILAIRARYGIATAAQLDLATVSSPAMLVMVHGLERGQQVTALNFSTAPVVATAQSEHLAVGSAVENMVTQEKLPDVGQDHTLHLEMQPHEGLPLRIAPPTTKR